MIARDKLLHAAFGAAAALGALGLVWLAKNTAIEIAMLVSAIVVGGAYEAVQKYRGEGEPDVNDFVATALGGAAATLAVSLGGALILALIGPM